MPINLAPLPQFPSRNLGQWAECALPVQGRDSFSDILLRVAGQGLGVAATPLDIVHAVETIELQQDGETVMSASPRALRLMHFIRDANSEALDPSVLHIPLSRLGLSSVSDWPTGKMGKFLLRVLLKAAFPANGANPAMTLTEITAHARSEQLPEPMGRGAVFTFHMASHLPVAGVNIIENLSLRNLRKLTKLILFCPPIAPNLTNPASLAIVNVKVTAGREVVYEATKQIAIAELISSPLYRGNYIGFSTTESFPVIFDVTARPLDYLSLVDGNVRKTLKVEYTWDGAIAAAQTIHILAEGVIEDGGAPLVSGI